MENEAVVIANEQADKWKKELFDWVETLVIALSVVMIVFTFFFRLVNVKGGSMDNSFHDQDRVVISDVGYTPAAGDVVVLALPQYFSEPIIKRIIAVGGQTVDIDFTTGTVYVDGQALEEPYIKEKTYTSGRKTSWSYGKTTTSYEEFYARYEGLTVAMLDNPKIFGFC